MNFKKILVSNMHLKTRTLVLTIGCFIFSSTASANNSYSYYENTDVMTNQAGNTITLANNGGGWFQNEGNPASLTNNGVISSDNWFQNGSNGNSSTNVVTNNGTITTVGWLQNGSNGDNSTNTFTNNGTITIGFWFQNGSNGDNSTNTFTNNGTIINNWWFVNGSNGKNGTSTLINTGTISSKSPFALGNNGTLFNSGTINNVINGSGTYTQSGGTLTLGDTVYQSAITVQDGQIDLIAGTSSFSSGQTFDIFSASHITFAGNANPTTSYINSFFDTSAFNNAGLNVKFNETFNGGNLIDISATLVSAVPEPEEWAMMLLGLGIVGWKFQRKPTYGNIVMAA